MIWECFTSSAPYLVYFGFFLCLVQPTIDEIIKDLRGPK